MRAASFFYSWLESSRGYALIQAVGKPTVRIFRELIAKHIQVTSEDFLLDVGCGIANYRPCFRSQYTGIDINSRYMNRARDRFQGDCFAVMDCTKLALAPESFRAAVSVATTHHLSDTQLDTMINEGLRVLQPGGKLHVIDAVLPLFKSHLHKWLWFRLDRGAYPRSVEKLTHVIERSAKIEICDSRQGPLHDVVYLRLRSR